MSSNSVHDGVVLSLNSLSCYRLQSNEWMSVSSDLVGTCNLHKIIPQYMTIREPSFAVTGDFDRKNSAKLLFTQFTVKIEILMFPRKSREGRF